MKQIWPLLLLSFAGIGLVVNLHAQELHKTQIRDLNSGKKIAFNKGIGKGKPTLISFWATWCAHGKRQVKTIFRKLPAYSPSPFTGKFFMYSSASFLDLNLLKRTLSGTGPAIMKSVSAAFSFVC